MERIKVVLTLTEPVLGTVAKDPQVYTSYIAAKAEDPAKVQEELETQEEISHHREIKGWTGFHVSDGKPILYDYVLKGFFKDACGMLRRVDGTLSSACKAYKKLIDGLVFVFPRRIELVLPDGEEMSVTERPLRASTRQGDRVALARSDTCPAGTVLEFEVEIAGEITRALLLEWLDYGAKRGLGQWRNAGYGRFEYELPST